MTADRAGVTIKPALVMSGHLPRILLWLTPAVGLLLSQITAPYGRHQRPGWGPTLSTRQGWLIMELPALVCFLGAIVVGPGREMPWVSLLLTGMWCWHYAYRALLYPLRIHDRPQAMPLAIALLGAAFNVGNASLNGLWVAALELEVSGLTWLSNPTRAFGIALFFAASSLHRRSDRHLLALRRRNPGTYSLPRGGAFELVSCPNYLGEILQWCGWALCCQSLPAVAFAALTLANLAPRAAAHHRWYRERFPEFPRARRALIPWVW